MKRLKFSKKQRLLSNSQFKGVLACRAGAHDSLLTIFAAPNDLEYARLGVSIGKSCGNAVVRNRLKRLLREAFRQSQERIPGRFDYVIMISRALAKKLGRGGADEALPDSVFERFVGSILTLTVSAAEKASKRAAKTSE